MSISSRPVRQKKTTHWNLDHIQLELLTLERNDSRKSKLSTHHNQHYGKILSSFITKINQEYLLSVKKKHTQNELSQDSQSEHDQQKCAHLHHDSGKKKPKPKNDSDSKKYNKEEEGKKKYQYKKMYHSMNMNEGQGRVQEKRKVKSMEISENQWYRLYLINKMQPEGKNKGFKRSFYHVSTAYRIHFDNSKEKNLEQIDPTFCAKRFKRDCVSGMEDED